MRFKVATVFTLTAALAFSVYAQEAEVETDEPQENPLLEAEIAYVEKLVETGFSDFAAPVIEATKKKWPEAEVRFFAIEVRSMLSCGQFDAAEKKIAALPDRTSTKYWAARLEMANSYFGRSQKAECMKIYQEFFAAFPKPSADIRKFYIDACYCYGQLLVLDGKLEAAAERYEALMKMVVKDEAWWCTLGCDAVDIYLRLATKNAEDPKNKAARDKFLNAADKIVKKLLWKNESQPLFFGRAVSMLAHIEQIRGNMESAASMVDEYRDMLEQIHAQLREYDPDGSQGYLKQSPLPECLYLQAHILFDEAKREYAKTPKRDDEKIKVCMFGPKRSSGKRDFAKGAFAMAQSVFLNYETSAWAPQAGDLAQEIKDFTKEKYGKDVQCRITPEQIRKVRKAQFKEANEKFAGGQYKEAIDAYFVALAKYPEFIESITAIENVASSYIGLVHETNDADEKAEYRDNADAVEAYLAERFPDAKDRLVMIAAGDALVRLAAKEAEYKQATRADRLYEAFCRNFTRHPSAADIAASRADERLQGRHYEDALKFWRIISDVYTNSSVYAISLAKISECLGKLGDEPGEIEWKSKYLEVETVQIRRLQAQMQLAQLYQKRGLAILASAETNATPEAVEADERRGTAEIIRAVKNFQGFTKQAAEAMANPATPPGEKEKYNELREIALFLIGDCWGRMNRPEKNLEKYRQNAVKSYEAYLEAFPEGRFSTNGYVRVGTIYTALGDMAKAKDALDSLMRRFPESSEAKNAKPRLAKSLIEMGMKKEGTDIYAEMLRTDGAYTAGQFLAAGEALIEAKNWDLANQAYDRAIRLAGTNSMSTVARARLGIAKTAWKQGALAEAREALDQFLGDKDMSRMAIAADANFMLVEVASQQGRTEKDAMLRDKYFGAAIGALGKVRQYWKAQKKPDWEQARLDLISADVQVNRMNAEESMDLKGEAHDTCARAASAFQVFIQAHGVNDAHPIDKMEAEELANLERAYETMIPLLTKLGAAQADMVLRFGQEYLDYFPNGKGRTLVGNCMNQARADASAPPPVAQEQK